MESSKLEALPIIASLLSIEMQKSNFYLLNKMTFYSHLLHDLLAHDTPVDEDTYRMRFSIFGYKLERYKQVLLIDFKNRVIDASQAQYLAERTATLIPNCVYFIHEDSIIYLATNKEPDVANKINNLKLNNSLSDTSYIAGTSSEFTDISRFKLALYQARDAIRYGAKYQNVLPIYHYDDLRIGAMIETLLAGKPGLTTFLYPPLLRLIEHDQAFETKLIETLQHHLRNFAKPAKTCRELFIHKNTLYYRLGRISEIMAVDLEDPDVRCQIHLTFKMLERLEST